MLTFKITSSSLLEQLNYQMEGCCISLECWGAGGSTACHLSSEKSGCRIYFSFEQRVNQLVLNSGYFESILTDSSYLENWHILIGEI